MARPKKQPTEATPAPKKQTKQMPANWWHSITLPDGTTTPGVHNYDTATGDRYLFPDVTGKTVLDIGTFDGYWAARAVKNGAKSVHAIDRHILPTAEYISDLFNFKYTQEDDMNAPALAALGQFDVVLFYGVVYHLWNPVQGIMNAAVCVKPGGLLLIESACNQINTPADAVKFNPHTHDGDDTNYFMPSIQGLKDTVAVAFKVMGKEYSIEQEATDSGKFRITLQIRVK